MGIDGNRSGPKDENSFNFSASWNMVKRLADQISHSSLAIAELIKNSYDADASKVIVDLTNAMQSNADLCRMSIQDNGTGMTLSDIKTKWSNMGVSNNEREPYSKLKGRARQGGLGLGRFGAWKIGKKVTLVTRSSGQPVYMLQIDFSKYPPEMPIQDVKSKIETDPKGYSGLFPDGSTGTYIQIEKFNQTVSTASDLQRIHKQTLTLLNPFEPTEDFEIDLRLPDKFQKWETFQMRRIIEQAIYKYEVTVDLNGKKIRGKFTNNNPFTQSRGETEINCDLSTILDGEECVVKSLKIWMYHFSKKPSYSELWPRTAIGVLDKKTYDNNLSGFRLYKDGVRVLPYGERGEHWDWLSLDFFARKQRMADWFVNSQLIGGVRFDMAANKGIIVDKANREGLEDNVGRRQLFKIIQHQVKSFKALANQDYPEARPAHMIKPEFEYGSYTFTIDQNVSIQPRILKGQITSNFAVIRGNLPVGLSLDRRTGAITGAPFRESSEKVEITIEAGNEEGSFKARFVVFEVVQPEPEQPSSQPINLNFGSENDTQNNIGKDDETASTFPKVVRPSVDRILSMVHQFSQKMTPQLLRERLIRLRDEIDEALNELEEPV